MNLKSVRPRGTFHARVTKDPTAMARDGQIFVLVNELESRDAEDETLEIMFADGFWMLAKPADLELI